MAIQDRVFTLDEANALIPRLSYLMSRLQPALAVLRAAAEQIAAKVPAGTSIELSIEQDAEVREHAVVVRDLLVELQSYGVQMKGLELGLIDFPADIDGKRVLLCWQYGEDEVSYYHAPDEGFAGRKPLDPRGASRRVLQ